MDESPHTNNAGVDEEMEHLEQAIERGEDRFVLAQKHRAFDQRRQQLYRELCELAVESIEARNVGELEKIRTRMQAAHERLFPESPTSVGIEQEEI